MPKKAIIIGAGIAGIAAAVRLAIRGFEVEVMEANSYPGGKLAEIEIHGFRFDAGPSLFTMPQYVDELFELAGKKPRNYFNYQKLDVVCKYFYPDGSELTASSDIEEFAKEIGIKTAEKPAAIKSFLENSKRIYNITNHVFLERSLHRLSTYLRFATLKSILRLPQIDAFRSMHQANHAFFTDKKLVQYADRFATYNGSNPYKAPATLNVIPHLEQHFGAYFPKGGMYQITKSLVKLAEELGIRFHYNFLVEEIVLEGLKVKGVKVKGKIREAEIVISNMDVYFTYKKLFSAYPKLITEKTLQQERSSSALIFYWGIKKQFSQLDLHNIFFSENYEQEFKSIWQEKTISNDPTIYLNITSKFLPSDAPQGCENWFTMVNVPSNQGQDWDKLITKARTNIIKKLSKALGENVAELIVCERILDPRSIESKTSSYQGSLYGTSSNNQFAAFLRHANKSSKIKNLFFCGGSVHPGGGIPLALLSAKIVGDWVGQ